MPALRVLAAAAGVFLICGTFGSAVRTVVLPRAVPAWLGRRVFLTVRFLFKLRIGRRAGFARIDRIMASYGPVSLLTLLVVWLALVLAGYTLVFWAIGVRSLRAAFTMSGSSLLTLGTSHAPDLASTALAFSEAALGLVLLALLITYLPSIYGAFSRRESTVALLEVRAGSPSTQASVFEMIRRAWAIHGFETLAETGQQWERWFVELEESHTSFPVLAFFRSPDPARSWVVAAGTMLDASAVLIAAVEGGNVPDLSFCIRAGYLSLRAIARFFRVPIEANPTQDDPISIVRPEFDALLAQLEAAGVPLVADRDTAWRDFAGWRVNYDTALLALAAITLAPPAPWISDRSPILPHSTATLRRQLRR